MTISVSALAERALRRLGVRIVPLDDSPTLTEMVGFDTIATMALVELGVIASDETPIASDQALALDRVASVNAALDAAGVIWWGPDGPDGVPRAFVEDYVKLTAAQAASSFGRSSSQDAIAGLEARVRRGATVIASHDIAVEAVMGVHRDLVSRGMARWTSQDIPDTAVMAYEVLAADAMAPKFQAQVDADDVTEATRSLARLIALPTSGERVKAEYF